ncbi:MAG: metallophosphoesterase family protein [Candidatus Thermoplasmatota archaeon]|nr:metallophosphoesterase family protein [Candidatus Thermoplasmatota archaeon]
MKLLALSDIHGNESVLYWARELVQQHSPNIIALAGDITHFGPPQWAEGFVRGLRKLGPMVVGVPGNCDPPEVARSIELGGGVSLHDRRVELEGLVFAGVGGSDPTPFHTLYERDEKEFRKALEGMMSGVDVFVSHAPPMGKNDFSNFSGVHAGSPVLAEILEQHRPNVVITGHIHEARGIIEEKGIVYINPGKAGDGNAGMVEIVGGKVRALLL